jgi:UDP-3-O-[3-hydroxymyristoyl] glucosamine N-acyltransferase
MEGLMEYTAQEIANILKGEVEGDPGIKVSGFSKIDEGQKGTISFIANPKYNKYINNTEASVVLVNKDFTADGQVNSTLIKVDDAYSAFAKLLTLQDNHDIPDTGISDSAKIKDSAKIGENVSISEHVYIGENVTIEDDVKILPNCYVGDKSTIKKGSILYPDVKVYHSCIIGAKCIIHAGVVIGSDGFGFAPQSNNQYDKIPQVGNVIIEDNVEIGANTCIDRATIGSTIIRKGVKLDNLIQIAHNVEIGENTVIAAQTGIAGSTKVGKDCMLGGQVGLVGHIKIGDRVRIAAQSGITSNVKDDMVIQGSPAFDFGKYQKSYVLFRKLPDLYKKINELEAEIKKFKNEE